MTEHNEFTKHNFRTQLDANNRICSRVNNHNYYDTTLYTIKRNREKKWNRSGFEP